jgi:8-hydroxy-5-deazaflavin:NADPH oxidoreductase
VSAEKIAVIGGTGDLGLGLALRWGLAGAQVLIGSRDENKATLAATKVTERIGAAPAAQSRNISVTGLENAAAAAQASFVVLAVPISAHVAILKSIRNSMKNAILVDATVPLAAAIGGKPTRMLNLWQGSAAEQARELAPPGIPVVAAFHNISAVVLQDISATPECDILLCGDEPKSKEAVASLVKLIPGLRPVDAGPLEMARIAESITALLISVNKRYGGAHCGIRITGLDAAV